MIEAWAIRFGSSPVTLNDLLDTPLSLGMLPSDGPPEANSPSPSSLLDDPHDPGLFSYAVFRAAGADALRSRPRPHAIPGSYRRRVHARVLRWITHFTMGLHAAPTHDGRDDARILSVGIERYRLYWPRRGLVEGRLPEADATSDEVVAA